MDILQYMVVGLIIYLMSYKSDPTNMMWIFYAIMLVPVIVLIELISRITP